MERVISPEERIRRAEEIYYRRKAQGVRVSTTSVNVRKSSKISLGKKMFIQILICVIIYSTFWLLKTYNNVFSENIINQTNAILSYDVNLSKMYNQCVEYFNNNFNNIIKTNNDISNDESQENGESKDSTDDEGGENTQDSGIGGGTDESTGSQNDGTIKAKQDAENVSQMEQDAEYIKQNYNIIQPIQGTITSKFGDREETEIISAFHQGIDISAATGTAIPAAMEGTVVAASYAGDYGNHIKIKNGEVLTVYAHCSELEVNMGDYVIQGQEIGKVGATGKVTGPHLHFEIRRDGRYVDPELILNF